jgi:hypothetical protein
VRPSNLYVAEDAAQEVTEQLIRDAGYDPVHVGGLEHVRALEEYVLGLFSAIAGGGLGIVPLPVRQAEPAVEAADPPVDPPLREFPRTETGGAVVLPVAMVAVAWGNVYASSYEAVWGTQVSVPLPGGTATRPSRNCPATSRKPRSRWPALAGCS